MPIVTLGDKQMAQRIDNLIDTEESKRFYLQYSFPPSCVGEVGRIGAPNRREIGHGMLAERALEPILPSEKDFPYTVRVESTITESNGSSSMASVCGGCLALLDAGVPVKGTVAGIAMGLVLDTEEYGGDGTPLVLSDISGSEDASGDMDLKVAGNEHGITAFQMDIKTAGITLPVIEKALLQAKDGRMHVLQEMSKCSPPPSRKVSVHAPLIHVMKVNPEKIHLIIGSGGKKVKSIIEETGVEGIETNENGLVIKNKLDLRKLINPLGHSSKLAIALDLNCEIKSIVPYGVFVEIAPGHEAFKVGDRLDLKLIKVNEKGQLRLSRKALLPDASSTDNTNSPEQTSSAEDVSVKITSKPSIDEVETTVQKNGQSPKTSVSKTPLKRSLSPRKATSTTDKAVQKHKRSDSHAKDGSVASKDTQRRNSSTKATVGLSSSDEPNSIDAEAKVG
ncbi:hypothetical protein HPP92_014138 [Vanilla planifolia]|uniref:Exoribonuclease phosphorolytic domain-containing protein n=1 Tax=Vanilla planifolia TaxID=51239 RepID=A0A835R0R1_VANPL|nr:hypothetical protein HPP92_014138 [Vanilla planifolia]